MSLLDNLPDECTIYRRKTTKGSLQGTKTSLVEVETEVPCWEQPASDNQTVMYDKRGQVVSSKIYFNTQKNLTEQHIIKVTKKSGVTQTDPPELDVVSDAKPDAFAGLQGLFRVMVERTTGSVD